MTITYSDVLTWCKENQLVLGLLFSAIVGTMPEKLPSWCELHQWFWTWFRDAAKTFLNFKKGLPIYPPPAPQPSKTKELEKPQQLNG